MRAWLAILWLEWRRVRRDLAVLAAVAALAPLLLRDRVPAGAIVGLFAYSFVPITACLFGASLGADDPGVAFLHARAVSWRRAVLARLVLRCLAALLVALVSAACIHAGTPDGALLDAVLRGRPGASVAGLLAVAGFAAAGATAGAFCRSALAAVFVGWVSLSGVSLALLVAAGLLVASLRGSTGMGEAIPLLATAVPIATGTLSFLLAVAVLSIRTVPVPLEPRRLLENALGSRRVPGGR